VLLDNGPLWSPHGVQSSSHANPPVAWISLQADVSIHESLPQAGRGRVRVTKFEANELSAPMALQTYYQPVSHPHNYPSFVVKIIYIAVTPHAADVDVDTLMLDGEEQSKCPAITACYRLEISYI
jgi:hypothetical protein